MIFRVYCRINSSVELLVDEFTTFTEELCARSISLLAEALRGADDSKNVDITPSVVRSFIESSLKEEFEKKHSRVSITGDWISPTEFVVYAEPGTGITHGTYTLQ